MGTVGGGRTVHAPLMRPLTPSSVGLSLHHIEHQLLEAEVQLDNYTSGLIANFEMMRCQPLTQPQAQPTSMCTCTCSSPPGVTQRGESGREGGLNVGDLREKVLCSGYLKGDNDQVVVCVDKEERLSAVSEERRPASGHGSRPSTRGSRWEK